MKISAMEAIPVEVPTRPRGRDWKSTIRPDVLPLRVSSSMWHRDCGHRSGYSIPSRRHHYRQHRDQNRRLVHHTLVC